MTNKLEFVLNKIKEKCPELMELSEGCFYKDERGCIYKCVKFVGDYVWGRLYRYGEFSNTIYKSTCIVHTCKR